MAQHDPQVIRSSFRGCVRTYYSYDDELYAGTFPEEWAKDHAPETGPKECENCRDHGFWNGVFMLYCANCATSTCMTSATQTFVIHLRMPSTDTHPSSFIATHEMSWLHSQE